MVALDALGWEDKVDVVGGARIESKARSMGPNEITISIGPRWDRTPINPQFLGLLEGALALGMRAMIGPRRIPDSLAVLGFGDGFYEPDSDGASVRAARRSAFCASIDRDMCHKNITF